MSLRKLVRLPNGRARIIVGLLLAGLFCIQCAPTEALEQNKYVQVVDGKSVGANAPDVLKDVEKLAREDHIALLEKCLKHTRANYSDYTCTFIKQERINGDVKPEQTIEVKFLREPYSVAMTWVKNVPVAEKILYREGHYDGQMLVKPSGFLGSLVGSVLRPPAGEAAMKNTLRPVSMFGFERGLENLLDVYRQADQAGDLKEAYGGHVKVNDRDAIALVRYLPAKNEYPAQKTVICIDLEYLVPVSIQSWDWDGEPASNYVYKDIKFNVGLTPDDFTPKAVGIPPK